MGGYENLLVYRLSVTLHDLTVKFCDSYMSYKSNQSYRTYDQMVQAARSGKQNIVEGSLEKSVEMNIKLTGVGRASFGELWPFSDPRVTRLRQLKESISSPTNLTNLTNWTNLNFDNPENFANLMVCLIFKENYLLDQLLRSQEDKFLHEGGFRENLFKKRRSYLQSGKI